MRLNIKKLFIVGLTFILILFAVAGIGVFVFVKWLRRPYKPLNEVRTIAPTINKTERVRFKDPFGIATSEDGVIFLTDGETGKLWSIDEEGEAKVLAEGFDTPSSIAISSDESIVVADTGDHTIKRVNVKNGEVTIIAGLKGKAGFADGKATESLFNGPIGVAVGKDGNIFVADTYNDSIRVIDVQGFVRTLAGSSSSSGNGPGYEDNADGKLARFDTPSGLVQMTDGSLILADTGNNALRRVDLNGVVTTFAKTGRASSEPNDLLQFEFFEPMAIAVDKEGVLYVADSGNSAIRRCETQPAVKCTTLTGGNGPGLLDGSFDKAKFNRLSSLSIAHNGTIIIADTGNGQVRAIVGKERERGKISTADDEKALRPKAEDFRAASPPRWPYDPPTRAREIAATFGEIRGEMETPNGEAHFHNGLDIPGPMGETVRSIRGEKTLRPISVGLFGTRREYLRLPSLGYVHINVGRDLKDNALDKENFLFVYNQDKKLSSVRVRRGTRFNAGEALGTLNNMYHVHLIAGPFGAEMNALAALELPGIKDTVAPTVEEKDSVKFFDKDWNELKPNSKFQIPNSKSKKPDSKKNRLSAIVLSGDARIVVRAYDQMDGNAARRRLGAYRLGYQILKADGTPVDGFAEPLTTISFERLPKDYRVAKLVYATGSQANATGETIFSYVVTNTVKDGEAKEDFWKTSSLQAGNYIVRVFVEDFFGNRTTKDVAVQVRN
jgi:sugar lactone lactonase YvrE